MRQLLLIRHAKSSWKHDVSDAERPLNKRGFNDAALVSKSFKNVAFIPDIIFSSPAKRALTTCDIFIKNLDFDDKIIHVKDELYDFEGQNVIDFITQIDDSYEKVMIFGHNHAFTSICNIFGDQFIDNLPTSGLVVLNFDVNTWQNVKNGITKLTIFPRDLK
ncbi:SixA phosphatase family protein [Psychroserpens ponticola]|uniref:Histidine phosphatase family protein n=1 Tax=Psychroserpens ponticola TaxID=2932268 RepID=A0ABY7S227_9FLAO|nr:histidine phosphatase family protein [Psychroserpens ponticola]WCO03062.1 histidine phosphatase family protein [Psychroserpens ponticola]